MSTGPSTNAPGHLTPGLLTILTLAAIAAMGSMAIHMLVPALPLLAGDLSIGPAQAQSAVSVYLAGLGGGQLIAGPFADRIGRRPVMLAGLACYTVGAIAGALAPNLPLLLVARLLQALGGAAGVVAARVMVGDLFNRTEAAGKQATLMTIVLVSPALAPVVGGAIAAMWGWREILAVLSLCGIGAFAIAWRNLPESRRNDPAFENRGNPLRALPRDFARLLRNRRFVLTTAALAGSSSGLYMFLGSSSFLLIRRFGMSPAEAGACLLLIAAAGIVGTRLVAPVERRGDALVTGTALAMSGAAIALILATLGVVGPLPLLSPVILLGLGAGLVGPAAINGVIFAEEGLAATATSLAGATQMLASGTAMSLLGVFSPIDPLRLALALACSTCFALMCAIAR